MPRMNLPSGFLPQTIEPNDIALPLSDMNPQSSTQQVIRNVGQPFYFNDIPEENTEISDASDNHRRTDRIVHSFPPFKSTERYSKLSQDENEDDITDADKTKKGEAMDAAKVTLRSIWKILRFRTTGLLMAMTFLEAFIYSTILTSLPVLATDLLQWGKIELALLGMINKFLSVIVSGLVFFLTDHLEDFLLLVYGSFSSLMALLTLSLLQMVETNRTATTVGFFLVAAFSIAGIPMIITSTRSMLAKIVPSEIQSLTEAVRMSVFEASFVPAGFIVPLVILNIPAVAIFLLTCLVGLIVLVVKDMNTFVELKEVDDYWKEIEKPASNTNQKKNSGNSSER